MPKLLLKFNAAVLKEIPVEKTSITVGRKPDNDIVIDNPAVSGHHCRIVLKGGIYYVEDLGSTNGTSVNKERVQEAGLHHNDVIGVAKHALVFLEDNPPPQPSSGAPPPPDSTVMLSSVERDALARSVMANADDDAQIGVLRVLKGGAGAAEYELKGLSTYIGKSDRAQIPIKGSGFFRSAPEVAASIHRKSGGYVLVAVKPGYPVVNGESVAEQVELKDGDIIECGATTLQFSLK